MYLVTRLRSNPAEPVRGDPENLDAPAADHS